jgi:thiol-disulfide isomerase/thioredoxin
MDATQAQPDVPARGRASKWMFLAVLAAVIFVYIVVVTAPRRGSKGTEGPAIGHRLPYLELEPLTGDARVVSFDDLKGRVTLVNYWGTWCPPCIAEFPELVDLANELADQGDFRFYPVSCGSEGNDEDLDELRAATEAFLAARKVELATYADRNAASRRAVILLLQLDPFPYPTTLVLDRQGRIRGFWTGYDPRAIDEMRSLVEGLLKQPGS